MQISFLWISRWQSHLHRFQPGFSGLLRVCFANPDHAAAHRSQRIVIKDYFDDLPTLNPAIFAKSETLSRGIKHEARESFWTSIRIDH